MMSKIVGKFGFKMEIGEVAFMIRKPRFSPIILMSLMGALMGLAAILISVIR